MLTARRVLLSQFAMALLALSPAGCADDADVSDRSTDPLWAWQGTIWPANADGSTTISVCWETPGFAAERQHVRSIVADSWSTVTRVDFVGWNDCGSGTADLRIKIDPNQTSGVNAFGRQLKGLAGGLVLRQTLLTGGSCQGGTITGPGCLIGAVMHEFGHVLGFLHEQDRAGAPPVCPNGEDKHTGTPLSVGVYLTEYDPESIMNYCHAPVYYVTPALSPKDIKGAQKWYGKRDAITTTPHPDGAR